ncbi:hypothetical protein [Fortiea contorta]|uniref:hypothetical protein n=1 Tax=Fortiea contorta TaxID=1892405 RepID=UPI00034BA3BE|nr:hypothetical protein [Fortiea contorta]
MGAESSVVTPLSDFSGISTITTGSGNSGDIFIETENLSLQNINSINTFSYAAQGNAGNIFIRASNLVNLDNISTLGTLSLGIGSDSTTGSGGLAERPGDAPLSSFNTGVIQSLSTSNSQSRRWKLGDPIWEAQGVYQLANGQKILSRVCGE